MGEGGDISFRAEMLHVVNVEFWFCVSGNSKVTMFHDYPQPSAQGKSGKGYNY